MLKTKKKCFIFGTSASADLMGNKNGTYLEFLFRISIQLTFSYYNNFRMSVFLILYLLQVLIVFIIPLLGMRADIETQRVKFCASIDKA